MASLNRFMGIGNLTSNPESRRTNSNQEVTTVSVAINEKFKDKDGNQKESVEFVNLVFWRKQSEILNRYCKKGSKIYFDGKLQTQSWDDPNGQKRYKTEIVVSNFQMLGSGKGQQQAPQNSVPEYIPEEPPF